MRKTVYWLFLVTCLFGCQTDQPTPSSSSPTGPTSYDDGRANEHLLLGNPSLANTDPANTINFLLLKEQYVVSYSRLLSRANWVSWHLQRNDLGATDRQDDFRPDDSLPVGWYRVKPADYTAADGFDRGHLCPSGDRTRSKVNNSATFLMTNIIPQAPALNRGVWQELEAYCRELVQDGNELYIVSGGYGEGATGVKGYKTTLATGQIKTPAHCWKIIVALPQGENDLSRINAQSTVIAVDMLNAQTVQNGWEDYIVTISDVEKATNYAFLSTLSVSLQAILKNRKYSVLPMTTPPVTSTTTSPATATTTAPVTGTATPPISTTATAPSTGTTATPTTGDVKCGTYNGKQLYKGPKDGCYYINGNGNKTYVDRSLCTC